MKHGTDRILTIHVGSLPRPGLVLNKMRDGERGEDLAGAATEAVTAAVRGPRLAAALAVSPAPLAPAARHARTRVTPGPTP